MSIVRINHWAVVAKRGAASQSGAPQIYLRGLVTGHPSYQDGSQITTSHITHRNGDHLVTCNGTHYELGDIHPDYLATFPNAREDLLRRFPQQASEETTFVFRPPENNSVSGSGCSEPLGDPSACPPPGTHPRMSGLT